MAYTLGNKGAKNLCKRTVLVQLIIKNVDITCFLRQCSSVLAVKHDADTTPTRSFSNIFIHHEW